MLFHHEQACFSILRQEANAIKSILKGPKKAPCAVFFSLGGSELLVAGAALTAHMFPVLLVQVYQPSEADLAAAMEPYANTVCMVCLECDNEHLLVSHHIS
jgi:hypothetical protein